MLPFAVKVALPILITLVLARCVQGQDAPTLPSLVPAPAELQLRPGICALAPSAQIVAQADNAEVWSVAEYLCRTLTSEQALLLELIDANTAPQRRANIAQLALLIEPGTATDSPESYTLDVAPLDIRLSAPTATGLFRGVQTLRQLIHHRLGTDDQPDAKVGVYWELPCLHIHDYPRYPWRGSLLDCGRHFMSKEFVKRYIDLLAYHKMNVLHWHLTEDQGWRIEIRKYPMLTEIGAWRKATRESEQPRRGDMYGGFYSQDDVREIVAYAASRHVTVIPEIELPGHSGAALAAYPELSCTGGPFEVNTEWGVHSDVYCAGNDETFAFLENVLAEVVELFPAEYIHIGGDECPKERWKKCPKCQARIKALGLKDEHELQSYFVRRIEKFLNSKGRRLVGWDEILEGGLAPNATVQSWRGMQGAIAAAGSGHDVISSPTSNCYLDYAQLQLPTEPVLMGYVSLEKCYTFEPTPAELSAEQQKHVLGLEGNIWTEWAPQSRVEWQVFPRLCALAEVGWSPTGQRNWDDFRRRMRAHFDRLDALGVTYCIDPPSCEAEQGVFEKKQLVTLSNPWNRGEIRYTLDGSDPMAESPEYNGPLTLDASAQVNARVFLPNGRHSPTRELHFRKNAPQTPVVVENAQPGLNCAYFEGRWRQLPRFRDLKPTAVSISDVVDLSGRKRDTTFGLVLAGFVEVPTDGTYTFYLSSDDGSRLFIGGELIIDHDGVHAAAEQKSGQVQLDAGLHTLRVEYFQLSGPQALELSYEGPGIKKQPVPRSALRHVE